MCDYQTLDEYLKISLFYTENKQEKQAETNNKQLL